MAKKLLIGAAVFGLAILVIALLVPAVMAGNGNGTPVETGANFLDEDGDGVCDYFVDEDGDGINDNAAGNARDDDEDGIPNGQDEDYERPEEGSGDMHRYNGNQDDTEGKGNGASSGNSQGGDSSQGSRNRDGSCEE